ncbi:MAG TPA: PHP domain-containing protein [Anaerovoracaceae bacterium]|nr:PHP domain-containing protein [Anaerovoracaceae bacterium]
MLKADLHIHSTVSDGSETIEQILTMAEDKGLDFIAITEHDTLSHLSRISRLARETRVKVAGGVEISAVDPSNHLRAHILGYNIATPELVTELTQPLLEARSLNSETQAKILIRHGYKIDLEKLKRADGKYLYKQHIMDYLTSTGQAKIMFGKFYNRVFKNGGVCDFDIEYVDVFKAVETVKKAGGQAVLAHSGQQQNFYLIPRLAECGLDGLELNHHSHSEEDKKLIRDYAEQYGLYLTGGSDYHGRYEPQPYGVGDFISEESGARALCQG